MHRAVREVAKETLKKDLTVKGWQEEDEPVRETEGASRHKEIRRQLRGSKAKSFSCVP